MKSTLPLFPTDDGWPYPDMPRAEPLADTPDLDALEMLGPHAFDCLTPEERDALFKHFGLRGNAAVSMKELAPLLGCSRSDARDILGRAIDKVRVQLSAE
jgi:DNA-directed RNA polymerase sigma subunit (sigma70/sigma32)